MATLQEQLEQVIAENTELKSAVSALANEKKQAIALEEIAENQLIIMSALAEIYEGGAR